MTPHRPAAVTGATWLSVAVVAMTGVTALLTLVFDDELVDAWAAGRTASSAVEPPAFVPVAVTMFVVVALLSVVLIAFLREGHEWARIVLSALGHLRQKFVVQTLVVHQALYRGTPQRY